MSENKINVTTFCNWQGLNHNDKFVLSKMFKPDVEKTYDEWYGSIGDWIVLGDRKNLTVQAPLVETDQTEEAAESVTKPVGNKKPNK